MRTKLKSLMIGLLSVMVFSGCGSDPAVEQFKNEIDAFCTAISEIDTSINNVDATSEYAVAELMRHLDDLEEEFRDFAELDFPEEFDYMESLADEAGSYMTTAVNSYHDAYSNDSYDQTTAEYARENYTRAYKRIQIIISLLHGEIPQDVDLQTQ